MFVEVTRGVAVKRYHRINQQITAAQVRVIDQNGKQIGVLSMTQALGKAKEAGLDLVEVAPQAKPPVVRIINFSKFKYQEEKKEKEAKKHTKETDLKEVWLTPFIGEHDFQTALEKIKRFLAEGNLVKVAIIFTRRQMAHTEFGPRLLARIMDQLEGIAQKERPEKFEGKRLVTILKQAKGSAKA